MNILIWTALTLSLVPASFAVWVFAHLSMGIRIAPDDYVLMELWGYSLVLCVILIAWGAFVVKILRGIK